MKTEREVRLEKLLRRAYSTLCSFGLQGGWIDDIESELYEMGEENDEDGEDEYEDSGDNRSDLIVIVK